MPSRMKPEDVKTALGVSLPRWMAESLRAKAIGEGVPVSAIAQRAIDVEFDRLDTLQVAANTLQYDFGDEFRGRIQRTAHTEKRTPR